MKTLLFAVLGVIVLPAHAQTLERLDLAPGADSSAPFGFTPLGDRVAFVATDSDGSFRLWTTDGTAAGTTVFATLPTGVTVRSALNAVGGSVFFTASTLEHQLERLWKSDGTVAGTLPITPVGVAVASRPIAFEGRLYFPAQSQEEGLELWSSDGTPEGTRLLRDVFVGPRSSSPASARVAGQRLYFTADNGTNGREIWSTDGTAGGTRMLANITPDEVAGPAGGSSVIGALGNTLLLAGRTYDTGRELWASGGTDPGTRLLRDIAPGANSSTPSYLTNLGPYTYFFASLPDPVTAQYAYALWRTDGTAEGTVEAAPVATTSGLVGHLTRAENRLFFLVNAGSSTGEVWVSDGTAGGTRALRQIEVSPYGEAGLPFTALRDRVYFYGRAHVGVALWESDGTSEGTRPVEGVPSISTNGSLVLAVVGDRLLLRGNDAAQGQELWIFTPSRSTSAAPDEGVVAPTLRVAGSTVLLSGSGERTTVDSFDALGRHVARLHQGATGPEPQHLSLPPGLSSGVYVVRAVGERGGQASVRVVVTR